ncbi:FAD-dependent oxidoreductase [Benzoatithermus flavus]|uniref:NADH:flavin oxidoreductase n=1 Tax=Benzoatithermus flavus TaxID=3108223 RepID=A0ABU8XV51_9PROT
MATDPVLEPFQLKGLRLKNRIMSTAHAPSYVEDNKPTLRYRLYHEEKAKGGLALTMFGGSTTTAPDSPSAFGQINASTDAIIPYFQKLAEVVHRHDCAIMCQITHMGRRTCDDVADWLPTLAPSPVRERQHRSFPKVIEPHEIRRVIRGYAAGARRCMEGGLDGCEVIAWGHLIDQFLSPAINKRDDEYGGSLENRCRFALEVFGAIREAVGKDFIVGIRLTGDEHVPGGRDPAESEAIARILAESGLIDFFNVVGGTLGTDAQVAYTIPSMGRRSAPFLELAGRIKKATGLPVFQASRITDLATARWALEQGFVDMVGMTRAHIADPHIVAKLRRGEEHRIRPCVGMGYCIDRIYQGKDALCIHNAATGREATMPHVVPPTEGRRRKVVVVGGGVAGMEAARVAKLRGHEVVLLEATDRLGGQVNLAAKAPGREEVAGIAGWLAAELEILGVDVRLNTYAEADDVLALEPDVVIVATGGIPNTSFLEAGEDLVSSVWDVLGGYVEPTGSVLLYDDHGWHQGPSTAVALAKKGLEVEVVTPDRMVAFEVGATNFPNYLREFYRHGVKVTPDLELRSVRRDGNRLVATFWNEYNEETVERVADHVVVEHGTLPVDELYFALKEGSRNGGEIDVEGLVRGAPEEIVVNPEGRYLLYRVGDAVSSRNIHAAIYDSLRLCKGL